MKICTCISVCRGIDSLGEDWVCGLTICPNPQCRNGAVDTGAMNQDGSWISIACPWGGHTNKLNPEWLKLEGKPHFVPAICHPDNFIQRQRELVEWAMTLLCSATPNAKLLNEEKQKEWCAGFGKWFAEANASISSKTTTKPIMNNPISDTELAALTATVNWQTAMLNADMVQYGERQTDPCTPETVALHEALKNRGITFPK